MLVRVLEGLGWELRLKAVVGWVLGGGVALALVGLAASLVMELNGEPNNTKPLRPRLWMTLLINPWMVLPKIV